MPITTRTIAKGVPLRLHEPKTKGKPHTTNNMTAKGKAKELGSHKRSIRDDDSDSEDGDVSISNDSESQSKQNKDRKRRRMEPEVEVVDEDVEPPEKDVKDVEDVGGQEPLDEQDVSASHIS